MKYIGRILLKGLVTILPIGITAYLVYWLARTMETLVAPVLKLFLPTGRYVPGIGLITGLALLFLIGLFVNAYVVRRVIGFGESMLLRIPVVKTVYSSVRDMTKLVNTEGRKRELERVVMVRFGPGRMIGFVTQENATLPGVTSDQELVAVYFPLSYQIGGHTFYLPRDRIEHTDLTVEAAMRIVLTGGLQGR
ncbi:MAG: DUF502 domain-containing protein [Steroidobacteraceae bacterium]